MTNKKDTKKATKPQAAVAQTPEPSVKPDEKQELIDTLKRLQAEFENYRKRADAECRSSQSRGENAVIIELLPVIDSFEQALKHSDGKSELHTGVQHIYTQLLSQLERLGIHRIQETGIVDPKLHEVYLVAQNSGPEGTIIETLQHGYVREGTVLRTAKVKAARNTP